MFHFSPRNSSILAIGTVICLAVAAQSQAQLLLASSSVSSQPGTAISKSNADLRDITPAKLITAQVRNGILTIDGMVAKVQLNYEIQRDGYLYFFVPGTGTAVLSLAPMPGADKVSDAFNGDRLAFAVGGHSFELTSDGNLLSRDRTKSDVYVRFDTSAVAVGRYPRMGFGNTLEAPYTWPLSAPASKDKYVHYVTPPPLPRNLLPATGATEMSAVQAPRMVRQ